MTFLGFVLSLASLLVALVYLIYKLIFWDSFEIGLAPIVIGLFTLGFFQIFILGFIGEYVMSILTHSRKLPWL